MIFSFSQLVNTFLKLFFNHTDLLWFIYPGCYVGIKLLTDPIARRPRRPTQSPYNKNILIPTYIPADYPLYIPRDDPLLRAITPWIYLLITPYTARLPFERKKKPQSVTMWQNEDLNELYCYYMPRMCPVAKLAYVPSSCKAYSASISTYSLVLYNGISTFGIPRNLIIFCLVLGTWR